jgi:hypothetical protein
MPVLMLTGRDPRPYAPEPIDKPMRIVAAAATFHAP